MITETDTQNALRWKVAAYASWRCVDCGGNMMCVINDGDGPVDPLTDLNACAKLWDFLAERGWTCRLENRFDKTWECTFETGTSGRKDFRQHYVPADTLEMAVCSAFVAAMETQ